MEVEKSVLPIIQPARTGYRRDHKLPYSIRVLLESFCGIVTAVVEEEDVRNLARWNAADPGTKEIPFKPARVVLQDFAEVPAVVDRQPCVRRWNLGRRS